MRNEPREIEGADSIWRGSVMEVSTNQERRFEDPGALFDFILERAVAAGVILPRKDQRGHR